MPPASQDQGINWYEPAKIILSNPGQQVIGPYGWSGKSGKWKNARFNLDMVTQSKRSQVRIRMAFSSNANVPNDKYEGFAFDNFFIGDKKRVVIIEHFTNADFPGSISADNYLNTLYANEIALRPNPVPPPAGYSDFNDIQYHMSYLTNGKDPLTNENSTVRAQNFGE